MRNWERRAECGKLRAEFGEWRAESEGCGFSTYRCAEPAPVPQAYCTDNVSSLFNSLNTPYRCGTNTVEDGIKNISSILSKTVLTLHKIRV